MLDVERLYTDHGADLRRFLARRIGADDAEDLTQVVFLRIVRFSDRYAETGQERGWLFQVARNVLRDEITTRSRRPVCVGLVEWRDATSDAGNEQHVTRLMIDDAIGRLSPPQQRVIVRRFFRRDTAPVIASSDRCSLVSVKQRQKRAIHTLRRLLPRTHVQEV
jgi:RNA polymerase sigma factor (sigma-70 family)